MSDFDNLSEREKKNAAASLEGWWWLRRLLMVFLALVLALMAGCPRYKVWSSGMSGKAQLKQAEHNRQIAVNEAIALNDSAKYKADAEIERARGIDEANKIISSSLGGPEGYLRYLYIDALQSTNCEIIYVPTEAGIPITEASRFNKVSSND